MDTTTTTPPPPGSVGGETGQVPPDPTAADFPGPAGECWHSVPLFQAPDHASLVPYDQDADGAQELWLFWDSDGGQGPGDVTIFGLDATGAVLSEVVVSGFAFAMGDVEGDGFLDILAVAFGMGPPTFAYVAATGPATFQLPPAPLELPLDQNLNGFFDVTGDGPIDIFQLVETNELELSVGDGIGGFEPIARAPIGDIGFVATAPVRGASEQVVAWSLAGFGSPDPNCTATGYRLLEAKGDVLEVLGTDEGAGLAGLGAFMGAGVVHGGATTVLYADSCIPGSDLHDLRQLVAEDDSLTFEEIVAVEGMAWVSYGDIDGDGLTDLVYAEPGAETMTFARGLDDLAFDAGQATTINAGDVRDNNVRTADLDGDGRMELIRGVVLVDGETAQLEYERVFLGPC